MRFCRIKKFKLVGMNVNLGANFIVDYLENTPCILLLAAKCPETMYETNSVFFSYSIIRVSHCETNMYLCVDTINTKVYVCVDTINLGFVD